jgi:hypothetical protein
MGNPGLVMGNPKVPALTLTITPPPAARIIGTTVCCMAIIGASTFR